MASPPRILLPDYPILVTSRTEEGLPFVPTKLMRLIVLGILARGQFLFNVTISHFLLMGNHIHLLMVVTDPDNIAKFMNHFKAETAHAINKLLGRRRHTVWCDGYDAEPILTLSDAIEKIAYLYTNPQAANLVSKIEEFPGVSSWHMFSSACHSASALWIPRPALTGQVGAAHESLYRQLLVSAKRAYTFTLSPNAWIRLFKVTGSEEIESINKRIMNRVRQREEELRQTRSRDDKPVLGAERLKAQPMDMHFTPKKFSCRMWCICSDVELRKQFIAYIKALIAKAKEVSARWRLGDFSLPYPLGLFPPRFPRLANLVPC